MGTPIQPVSLDTGDPQPPRNMHPGLWVMLVMVVVLGTVAVLWQLRPDGNDPESGTSLEENASDVVVLIATPTPQAPIEPTPSARRWTISSTPDGARVMVNGQYVGVTPVVASLQADLDLAEAVVQKTGYQSTQFVFQAGVASLSNHVELIQELGWVRIAELLPGAELTLNGEPVAVPEGRRLHLPTVPQRFRLVLDGYHDEEQELTPHREIEKELQFRPRPLATPTPKFDPEKPDALGIAMRRISLPEGVFFIGSRKGEQGRSSNENRRGVRFKRPFLMSVAEISNGQFRRFDPKHRSPGFKGESLDGNKQPVTSVSWQQAAAFCNWLSGERGLDPAYEKDGDSFRLIRPVTKGYRLPSEAEWEYVARDGQEGNRYPWGANFPPRGKVGNLAGKDASRLFVDFLKAFDDGVAATASSPFSDPNQQGVSDLAGNVAEWVGDLYEPRIGQQSVEVDFHGKESGTPLHVVKGSSFQSSSIAELRCARREYGKDGRLDVGFRVCRYLE